MNKKNIVVFAAVFISCVSVYFTSQRNSSKQQISDLTLSNIEALAQSEGGSEHVTPCISGGDACTYWTTLMDGSRGKVTIPGLSKCLICR